MATYQIETENGTYQIETDEPKQSIGSKLYEKAKSISPELVNPVNAIPGVVPVRALGAALDKSQEGYDLMGNMANEALGARGHTTLGPALGGTIQNIPNMVNAAQAIEAAPAMARGISEMGSALKQGAGKAVQRLRGLADALIGPGEKAATLQAAEYTAPARQVVQDVGSALKTANNPTPELLATQERQAGLGAKYGEKAQQLTSMRKEAGSAIGAVERKYDLGLKETPKFDAILKNEKAFKSRIDTLNRASDAGQLSKLDPQTLQTNREFLKVALDQPGLDKQTRVLLYKAQSGVNDALGVHVPELGEKLSAFKDVDQALRDLPRAKKQEADAIRLLLRRITNEIKSGKMTLQQKQVMAKDALDAVTKDAEELIARGTKRDINRGRLTKAALTISGLGYAKHKLGL